MKSAVKSVYCPALRMKAGELEGVRQLAVDVADRILPRFIVMPKCESNETNFSLFVPDSSPDISAVLAAHWRERPALIDLTYVIDQYGREDALIWLPKLFGQARNRRVRAIPMAMLADLNELGSVAFGAAIDYDESIKMQYASQLPISTATRQKHNFLSFSIMLVLNFKIVQSLLISEAGNFKTPILFLQLSVAGLRFFKNLDLGNKLYFKALTILREILQKTVSWWYGHEMSGLLGRKL